MSKYTPPTEDAVAESPSQEHRISHQRDMLLRENGYMIFARPLRSEPRWCKGGQVYTQSQALEEIGLFTGRALP